MTTQEQRDQYSEEAAIRANLYGVATAFFMSPPTAELLKALRENPLTPFTVDSGWNIDDLVQEYHDLFQVPTGAYVFPYESCYRARSRDNTPGGLMGQYAIQVQDLYQRAGFEVAPDALELPDHAGVEFGMLQKLAEQEAEAWRNGEDEAAGVWQRYQDALVARHMGHWIPDLCSEIEAKASQAYYQEFARWIRGFLSGPAECNEDCELTQVKSTGAKGEPENGVVGSSSGGSARNGVQTDQARV